MVTVCLHHEPLHSQPHSHSFCPGAPPGRPAGVSTGPLSRDQWPSCSQCLCHRPLPLEPQSSEVSQMHVQNWTHHSPPISATTYMLPVLSTLSWSSFPSLSSCQAKSQRITISNFLCSLKIHMPVVAKSNKFSLLNLWSAYSSHLPLP